MCQPGFCARTERDQSVAARVVKPFQKSRQSGIFEKGRFQKRPFSL